MGRLPRIACFHGGGSNGEIYAFQCIRLQEVLKDDFEFVYFDAPFERSAGPGVLPYFQDCAPFKTWFKTGKDGVELSDGSGFDRLGTDGVERVLKLMDAEGPAEDWVAAMGFSQGTRITSGLLLDQQRRAEAGNPRETNLKFGVLCMGGAAPMVSKISRGMFNTCLATLFTKCSTDFATATNHGRLVGGSASAAESNDHPITIPTLHLHGLKDDNLERGRHQLATYYDQKATTLYEIDYHHAMPWVKSEILHFAELIKQMYKDTQSQA